MRKASEEIAMANNKIYRVSKYRKDIEVMPEGDERDAGIAMCKRMGSLRQQLIRAKTAVQDFIEANADAVAGFDEKEFEAHKKEVRRLSEEAILIAFRVHLVFTDFGEWMVFSGLPYKRRSGINNDRREEDLFEEDTFDSAMEDYGAV